MGHLAVIILDTHIWIWWVHGDSKLSQTALDAIQQNEQIGIGIGAISFS
jgi:PIN domain nuclease of toxin-antitoxin system